MSKCWVFLLLFSSLTYLHAQQKDVYGAIVRSDLEQKTIFLVFTGHDYVDGFDHVLQVLKENTIQASFFLTGDFVRNHTELVKKIAGAGHFVGAHSDKHLLYNDWEKRDSLLVSQATIRKDILDNVRELESLGIFSSIFMPPYEWYNEKVVEIARAIGQTTVNFTPGTRSNADYTTPEMKNYISSQEILSSIYTYESTQGMSGFHLLIHPGVDSTRTDKFYLLLEKLILEMRERGYEFDRF